jgi:hypothetical protein
MYVKDFGEALEVFLKWRFAIRRHRAGAGDCIEVTQHILPTRLGKIYASALPVIIAQFDGGDDPDSDTGDHPVERLQG